MAVSRVEKTRELTNYLFWLFLLQGLVYVGLGILVVVYPAILFILVATNFIWLGITTFLLAMRVRRFHGDIAELLQ